MNIQYARGGAGNILVGMDCASVIDQAHDGSTDWALAGSVLDIDFMNDRSWFDGVDGNAFGRLTYARNSVAAYYDVAGLLQFATANTPRIDYHPITHAKLGFLAEQASGNYLLRSNEFNDAAWTVKTNVTITPAAAIGPDGTMSATKIEAIAAVATNFNQSVTNAGNASGNCGSVYAKKGSGATDANRFKLRNDTTATDLVDIILNYDTGAITGTGAANARAQQLPNGWWRVSLFSPTGISANDTLRLYIGYPGGTEAAGEFAYFYGAMLERQVFATSYFPTDGAAPAFRAADNLDLAVTSFSYSSLAGTLLGRYKSQQGQTTNGSVNSGCGLYVGGDVSNVERLVLYYYAQIAVATRMGSNGRAGNVSQWDLTGNRPADTFSKVGLAWQVNDIALSVEGSGPVTDNVAVIPTATRLAIGRGLQDTQYLNGHVDRVTYWNYRKPNAELVALTS